MLRKIAIAIFIIGWLWISLASFIHQGMVGGIMKIIIGTVLYYVLFYRMWRTTKRRSKFEKATDIWDFAEVLLFWKK